MTPTAWLVSMLAATALIYSGTAFAYLWASRPGMMLVFIGYVIANVGLIWDAVQK